MLGQAQLCSGSRAGQRAGRLCLRAALAPPVPRPTRRYRDAPQKAPCASPGAGPQTRPAPVPRPPPAATHPHGAAAEPPPPRPGPATTTSRESRVVAQGEETVALRSRETLRARGDALATGGPSPEAALGSERRPLPVGSRCRGDPRDASRLGAALRAPRAAPSAVLLGIYSVTVSHSVIPLRGCRVPCYGILSVPQLRG